MFLAKYIIDDKEMFAIYDDNKYGWGQYHEDTFSPYTKDIEILKLSIKGKTYKEQKESAIELAKDYQYNFSGLNWSYYELMIIQDYFSKIAKRYGLTKEFRNNGIC